MWDDPELYMYYMYLLLKHCYVPYVLVKALSALIIKFMYSMSKAMVYYKQ